MTDWTANLGKALAGTASKEQFIDGISYWLSTPLARTASNLEEAVSRRVSWKFSNGLVFSVGTDMHPTLSPVIGLVDQDDDKPVPTSDLDSWAWSHGINGWILKVDKSKFPEAFQTLGLLEGLEEIHGQSTLLIPWAHSWAKSIAAAKDNSNDEIAEPMHELCSALLSGELNQNSPWDLVLSAADEGIGEGSDYRFFRNFLDELEKRRIALVALDVPVGTFNEAGLEKLRQAKPELADLPAVGVFREGMERSFFGNGSICVSVDTSSSVEVEQAFRALSDEMGPISNQDVDVFREGWEPEGSVVFESDLWYLSGQHVWQSKLSTESIPEENTESGLWVNAHLKVVEANATKWFEDLGPKAVHELYPKQVEAHKDVHGYSAYFGGQEAGAIIPGMEINLDDLGEPDVIENTEIGRAVIAELRSRGVNFRFADSIPINHFQSIVLEVGDELLGQWGTELGTPFQHHFKVFKNEAGEETGLWFVQLLASPLPLSTANEYEIQEGDVAQILSVPDDQLAQGLFCFGEISTKIHLPILLKKIAYLAETPFPNSQLMSFSRDLAFKEVPKDARPIPTYSILKDKAFLSFAHGNEETGEPDSFKGQIVPEMVIFGWRFGKESLPHVSRFVPTIVDGCTLAVSTIEWGYNYHRKQDTSVDYDFSLSNPCKNYLDYVRGGSRLARPQWIPVTQLGDIITMCEKTLQNAQSRLYIEGGLAWAELKKVVNDGVGWYIASAINKLEWLWYIPLLVNDPEALPDSEYFLKQAISLNVQNESTQALIYLGLAKMMVGDYESAEKILRDARDNRPDKFGKAEIQYYRSLLHAKQGDRSGYMLLKNFVKELGGFLAPAYIEEALKLGQTNAPDFESKRPQNCGVCGTEFESKETNFCGSCGAGREEVSVSGEGSIGQGHPRVGFVLEISSINEELDEPMASETLADFTNESLMESGYGKIWRTALGQKALVDERDFTSTMWMDPTSFFSYLSALSGTVNGDLIAFSFDSEPNPTDLNSASWEIIRKRLRTSLVHDFLLREHRIDFESSGQSFYLEEFVVEGVNRLSLEKLEGAVKELRSAAPNSKSAMQFLEFFDPELQRISSLPSFISGHLWAHILSGCNWDLASQILEAKGSLSFDSDSFTWEPPAEDMPSYVGGYAVAWYRNVRRSVNFNPWPWRVGSIDQNGEPDPQGFFRDQVAQLLGGRPPVAHEKVAAFGALYFLVDHEDDEDDDAPNTQDRERTLIEDYMSDSVRDFITENLVLIKACFGALQEVLTDLGDGENWLPVWSGSEGFLAGVPPAYSKTENAEEIEFETSLIESVEKLWPEFISITSQKQA